MNMRSDRYDMNSSRTRRTVSSAVLLLLSFGSGMLLSDSSMAGVASFADISAAGAVSLPCSAALFTGSLLRSIIAGTVGKNIVRLTAILIVFIVRLFLETEGRPKLAGIVTGASVLAAGTGVSALIGELPYKLPFYLLYGAVSGFAAYSAALVIMSLRRQRILHLTGISGFAYGVVYVLFIASLCSISSPLPAGLDPGTAIGTAVTLLAAYYYYQYGGVLCGTLTICGAFLASPERGVSTALLPAAGLLTGCLKKQKLSVSAAFFLIVSFLMMILSGFTENSFGAAVNMVCGTILFLFAAPYYSDKWIAAGDGGASQLLPAMSAARTRFLSDSVESVRQETAQLPAGKPPTLRRSDPETVCGSCWRRPICRGSEASKTENGFRILESLPEITAETFPYELSSCVRRDRLIRAFERSRRKMMSDRLMQLRTADSRTLLSEQMRLTGELLRSSADCGGSLSSIRFSLPISLMIQGKLERHGVPVTSVFAYYNDRSRRSRLVVELYLPEEPAGGSSRILDLVCDELGILLECSSRISSGSEVKLTLCEPSEYTVEVCTSSLSAGGGESGDSCLTFRDGPGAVYSVISDGMGSGHEAAEVSGAAVDMFRRLITSGAEAVPAIRLINSVMLARSPEETFATLDSLRIDTDSLTMTVTKSGAADTLLLHEGSVMKIASPTFPLGIYEESEAYTADFSLSGEDVVIMFSDGVSESEYLFIKELLLGGSGLQHVVDEICRKAEVFNQASRSDDVTVIGMRIHKR